jgi:type I restriction enzyme R subunit
MNQPEYKLTTDHIREQLETAGWKFVPSSELVREGTDEPLLEENLREALRRINKDLNITEEEINEAVQRLKLGNPTAEGAKKILQFLKYGIGIKFEASKIVENVRFIDYANPDNNEFIISREVSFRGKERIRADIVLYVNGIPLVNIEGKNPAALSATWEDAYKQIKQYERDVPELYKYAQLGVAADVGAKYFPIAFWQNDVRTYEWKEEDKEGLDALSLMLQPHRLIDFVRNYIFIREENGEFGKVVARYMQHRASEKICERVTANIEGKDEKNKGLIWHWQGSGKTLTMIMAAHKLYYDQKLENPTIFFIIDRQDLEEQLSAEVAALDLNFKAETIENIKSLQETVKADDYKGKRGAFITLVHKFNPEKDWIPENIKKEVEAGDREGTIAERKNVIAFLDEVHRTQYGTLAGQMKDVLKNAFFFGFTGTPIAQKDKDTYKEFGYPVDEEEYLDRYFIDESQADGFTVPIIFEPRDDKLNVSTEELKKILEEQTGEDVMEDYEEGKLKGEAAKQVDSVKVFLESEKNIRKKSKDIAEDFKQRIDGRFKAMVVAGSRKACVLYKKALDELLGEEASEVVMTFDRNDKKEIIRDYYGEWQKKYTGNDNKKICDEIVRKYKEEETPKILIVTDMLLTGFDAPILQTMYFDKPLKEHKLLQAIARVNRVYKDVKEAGVVVDYVGIIKKAKKAISDYYKTEKISHAVFDYEDLLEKFSELVKEMEKIIGSTPTEITRDKLNEAMEELREPKKEEDFVSLYKEARKIFELLGSNEKKLKFLNQYKWLSSVFAYHSKLKGEGDKEEKARAEKYFQDTLKIIHDTVSIQEIKRDLPSFKLDKEYFEKLRESQSSKKEKVNNLVFGLERLVLVEKAQDPILLSVYEKVEELVRKWREKSVDYEELYDYGVEIIGEIEEKKSEQEEMNLSVLEYGIYLKLKDFLKKKSQKELAKLSQKLYGLIKDDLVEGWIDNSVLNKRVLSNTRDFARKIKVAERMSMEEMKKLYNNLASLIENHET